LIQRAIRVEALLPSENGPLVYPKQHGYVAAWDTFSQQEQRLPAQKDPLLDLSRAEHSFKPCPVLSRHFERHRRGAIVSPARPWRRIDHAWTSIPLIDPWQNF
jgi:hypothetical protein